MVASCARPTPLALDTLDESVRNTRRALAHIRRRHAREVICHRALLILEKIVNKPILSRSDSDREYVRRMERHIRRHAIVDYTPTTDAVKEIAKSINDYAASVEVPKTGISTCDSWSEKALLKEPIALRSDGTPVSPRLEACIPSFRPISSPGFARTR
jgi:hypothetical protein